MAGTGVGLADFAKETTTSIAGTSGDGAVTLTAISGFPRLSDAFGSGTVRCKYTIVDTVANKMEHGYGSHDGTAHTLTRTSPRVSWDGTTFNDLSPAAIQFGSAPTSGNIVVSCAPLSDDWLGALPYVCTSLGDDAGLISGHACEVGESLALAADAEYYMPYLWHGTGPIVQVAMNVVGGATASQGMKCGLYAIGSDGLPKEAIVRMNGDALSAASTGVKKATTTANWTPASKVKPPPGWYYAGLIVSHATPTYSAAARGAGTTSPPAGIHTGPLGWNPSVTYKCLPYLKKTTGSNTYTTGLPADASAAGSYTIQNSNAKHPLVAFKPGN